MQEAIKEVEDLINIQTSKTVIDELTEILDGLKRDAIKLKIVN